MIPVRIASHLLITGASILLLSCGPATSNIAENPNQEMVANYAAAYNARNIVGMSKMMHDEIEWINIEGSERAIITANKRQLVAELAAYFGSESNSESTLSDWSANGNFVSVKESVHTLTEDGGTRVQASHSVYEIEDNLIRRVWYFPAQKQEPLEVE